MASSDGQLEFVIKAVDEASSSLAAVTASMNAMKTAVDANTLALQGNGDKAAKTKVAHDSLATAVFKGVASWDLLKTAVKATGDFLEQSVTKFLDAQKKVDLMKSTIVSMGVSLDSALPQIDAFGQRMGMLGVDNEQASLSAAQLAKAAGNDVPKGLQLAKLAADLASSGYGDLTSNTDTLIGVLNGRGTMAIKQWHLNLESTATTADIVNAAQKRVTESTEAYAQTIPGQIAVVKNAYEQLQQSIGGGFVSAVGSAIKQSGLFGQAMDKNNQVMQMGTAVGFELGQMLVGIAQGFIVVAKTAALSVEGLDAAWQAMHGHLTEAEAEAKAGMDDLAKSIGDFSKTIGTILDPTKALADVQKNLANSFVNTSGAVSAAGAGLANEQKNATNTAVKLADKLQALKQAYAAVTQEASTDLATMADDHVKNLATISKSIHATQQAITDLQKSFNQGAADDEKGVAEQIVASQNKVADLKKQLGAATTQDNYDQLKVQLDAEQKNLDTSKDFIAGHAAAIAAAQQRASETDIQRAIDDYTAKRTLAVQEFNEKMADLQATLASQNAEQAAEISLYNAKVKAIGVLMTKANEDYIALSNNRLSQTTDEVNKEIQLFQQLAQAISASKSASASALATIAVPTLPHKAGGGTVMANQSYIVGENGPEVFTSGRTGTITPNGQLGSAGSITVQIMGGYYLSERAANDMAGYIVAQLRRKTRIGI